MSSGDERTRRIWVMPRCQSWCRSCMACDSGDSASPATLEQVQAAAAESGVVLGGGDATRWPPLYDFLATRGPGGPQVWLEAPAASLDGPTLQRLATAGLHGVVVQMEGAGPKMLAALGLGDAEEAVARAEALGLETRIRMVTRPSTMVALVAAANRLSPRPIKIEMINEDWGKTPVAVNLETMEAIFRLLPSMAFSDRLRFGGFLPPCALPNLWESRPSAWSSVLGRDRKPNDVVPACATCELSTRCSWNDLATLDEAGRESLRPVRIPPRRDRRDQHPVGIHIRKQRQDPPVICVAPWTTLEVVDPDGRVRQCCSTWTVGDRGNAHDAPLASVWNGEGYRKARRIMSGDKLGELCEPLCSRLYDQQFAEKRLQIESGSDRYVQNQNLLAEDIAARRQEVRGKPLYMALCPSTYCNYNCIMCDHGRTRRRDLPESIWDELPEFLPTLKSLTLLGGEPLANPRTMKLLQDFDVARYPDAAIDLVTNGSLLTQKALDRMPRCTLGDVTISVNAGDAETYERVQRGLTLDALLTNIGALLEFRRNHHRWFDITLSFILQPAAIDTIIPFGEIARTRNLNIRFMALNPEKFRELDFYVDPPVVDHVLTRIDEFIEWCRRLRPDWLPEARAGRRAVLGEAKRAQAGQRPERPLRILR